MYSGDALVTRDLFSVEVVCKVICDFKTGKAYGFDGLMAEHLLHCHPSAHLVVTYILVQSHDIVWPRTCSIHQGLDIPYWERAFV